MKLLQRPMVFARNPNINAFADLFDEGTQEDIS
jgi:hypothetical protein